MKNILQAQYIALSLLAAGLAMPALSQPGKPTIIEFDVPGAATGAYQGTQPWMINALGMVVGVYTLPSGGANGFVRAPDGTFTTFAVPGAAITVPVSINSKGQITGSSCVNGICTCFLRDPDGEFTQFYVPGTGEGQNDDAYGWNINESGEIAGYYIDGNGAWHSFVRAPDGAITTFEAPGASIIPGFGTYTAYSDGLNAEGAIVGWYALDDTGLTRSFLRHPNGNFTVFDPPGTSEGPNQGSNATGINELLEVAGAYDDANTVLHGYVRYPNGKFVTFDVPGATGTYPQNINAVGEIDGVYFDANGANHGFVRTPWGKILKFDPPDAGTGAGQGTFPGANNVEGVVPGYYLDANNVLHGFLWRR